MLAFRAHYVFPIDSPPIHDAIVAIDHDRIVAVAAANSPAGRDLLPAARDLGRVAILPGLINSHTHLEFSNLSEPLGSSGMPFSDWIRLVVHSRHARLAASETDPIAAGIAESIRSGTTALGEIASSPWQQEATLPLEITQFCEVICFRRDSDQQRYQTAFDAVCGTKIDSLSSIKWTEIFRPGISPHTPYSVRPELIHKCAQLSADRRIPLAIHLAESRQELQLLQTGTGPMVDLMHEFDQWDPTEIPLNSRALDYLKVLSTAHRTLIIHGNYLDAEEIAFLADQSQHMSVIYCPRTHAFFQHERYPLAQMLAAGVNVALSTDSRASNPNLSILSDLRFAGEQHPAVSPENVLRTITANAAKALGRDSEIGTLTLGKFADLAIIALPNQDTANPYELLYDPVCDVLATIFRGSAVHGEKVLQPQ